MNPKVKCKDVPKKKLKSINGPKCKRIGVSIKKNQAIKRNENGEKLFAVIALYGVSSNTNCW